jgi:hypothetical protein
MTNLHVLRYLLVATALLFGVAAGAAPAGAPAIVLLPFENLTGSAEAEREVWQAFAAAVEAKGWRVADRAELEAILEDERVRYFDSISDKVRAAVVEKTGASAIVSGVIYTWSEGRNPVVAISARLVRADGTLGWGEVGARSAEDTERAFGFGRDESTSLLLAATVERMMARFPAPNLESGPVRRKSRPMFVPGAVSYRAADLDPSRPHKVCILPFENLAADPVAPRIITDVLAVRLAAASGFEVVEPADLRAAAIKARIGTFRNISNEDLGRLAGAVGTSLFARGTIFEFEDPAGRGNSSPHLQMEMTVVDVEQARVVWSTQHVRDGSDYSGFLMRGAVSSVVSLTDRVIAEMIQAGTRATPRGEAAITARGGKRMPEKHSSLRGPRRGEKNEKD